MDKQVCFGWRKGWGGGGSATSAGVALAPAPNGLGRQPQALPAMSRRPSAMVVVSQKQWLQSIGACGQVRPNRGLGSFIKKDPALFVTLPNNQRLVSPAILEVDAVQPCDLRPPHATAEEHQHQR